MASELHQRIEEFRRRAELCEQHARETSDTLIREQFLTTAENWRKLVGEAETIINRGSGPIVPRSEE